MFSLEDVKSPLPELLKEGIFKQGQPPIQKMQDFLDLTENCCPPRLPDFERTIASAFLKATYPHITY
jgi:hypothetical protein